MQSPAVFMFLLERIRFSLHSSRAGGEVAASPALPHVLSEVQWLKSLPYLPKPGLKGPAPSH